MSCPFGETYAAWSIEGTPCDSGPDWHWSAGTGFGIGGTAPGAHVSVQTAVGPGELLVRLITPVSRTMSAPDFR